MTFLRALLLLGVTAGATACAGGTGPNGGPTGRVGLNFATNANTSAALGAVTAQLAPETYTEGGNTLVIERVELVLREIELERADSVGGCDDDDSSNGSSDDDCGEIELGARLFDLPLGTATAAQRAIAVDVPAGRYSEIEFELHKPSRSNDAAFVAANPAFDDVSIRVTGTWNGQAFTYLSDLEADYEIDFSPPLEVGTSGSTEFTINIDVGTWFRSSTGALIDPRTANRNQPNKSRVEQNIINSIRAFDDDDRDGRDDD